MEFKTQYIEKKTKKDMRIDNQDNVGCYKSFLISEQSQQIHMD